MKMRLLLDTDKPQAWQNIHAWEYPTPVEQFKDCVMMSVEDVAYVWYEWLFDTHILMHMCAKPSVKGAWLTKETINKLRYSWEFLGAERVYVVTSDEYINNLAARQGFEQDELGYYWET